MSEQKTSTDGLMKIGELAKAANVNVSTLKFYVKEELIRPALKTGAEHVLVFSRLRSHHTGNTHAAKGTVLPPFCDKASAELFRSRKPTGARTAGRHTQG